MAIYNFCGMLPVLPGPCQLMRYDSCVGAPLDYYFAMVNQAPDKLGMIMGNLLLAEDRILSEAVVLLSETPKCTQWEPKATFYFDPEMHAARVVAQRRRWNNGSVGGLMYSLVQFPAMFRNVNQHLATKLFMLVLYHYIALAFGCTCRSSKGRCMLLAP